MVLLSSQRSAGVLDFRGEGLIKSLSRDDLCNSFHILGNQVLFLWNSFLKFHRSVLTPYAQDLTWNYVIFLVSVFIYSNCDKWTCLFLDSSWFTPFSSNALL